MRTILWLRFLLVNAVRNLRRAPRRTVFNLLAIACAAGSLIIFRSFLEGVKTTFRHNLITSHFGHYQVYRKGYTDHKGENPFGYLIPDAQSQALKKDIERRTGPLALFSRRQEFYALLNYSDRSISARGIGTDAKEDQKFLTLSKVVEGRHLADGPENGIFVGKGLARQLGATPGAVLTLLATTEKGSINGLDVEVVGIFESGVTQLDESTFYVFEKAANQILRIEGASEILLGFQNDDELQYLPELKQLLKESYPDLELLHWHELARDMYDNSIAWLEKIFSVFHFIVLLIAALSILNVFSMSLLERAGEFGTLRAIGTFRREVVSIIFAESLLQSVLGTLLGVATALLLIFLPLKEGIWMPPPMSMSVPFHVTFAVPWHALPWIVSLCILIAGGSGVFPAMKMGRTNIVEALGRNV